MGSSVLNGEGNARNEVLSELNEKVYAQIGEQVY